MPERVHDGPQSIARSNRCSRTAVLTFTFTITNTTELGAKNGRSCVDTLPAGVQVAKPIGPPQPAPGAW
ncbi:MAG: hypothetical protein JO057_31215 [Chloroflexi bacterium]|nr:hypothetical protein [Chloroflexota bacterium]